MHRAVVVQRAKVVRGTTPKVTDDIVNLALVVKRPRDDEKCHIFRTCMLESFPHLGAFRLGRDGKPIVRL